MEMVLNSAHHKRDGGDDQEPPVEDFEQTIPVLIGQNGRNGDEAGDEVDGPEDDSHYVQSQPSFTTPSSPAVPASLLSRRGDNDFRSDSLSRCAIEKNRLRMTFSCRMNTELAAIHSMPAAMRHTSRNAHIASKSCIDVRSVAFPSITRILGSAVVRDRSIEKKSSQTTLNN